uniref:Ubiquitin-protein ligase n=1 Tax=Solanum tuberosum TaxID=4113 RepID=M1D2Y6_SOLTU
MEVSTRKPKISSTSTGIDRISSLPDDVLHNILSYLFIFYVVQLSMLSKRWRYVWTTMPYLHFDIDQFYPQRYCDFVIAGRFKDFINWVLISQGDFNKLVQFLLCFDNLFDESTILRWINHVTTRRNVQELVLKFRLGKPFELPYCLVTYRCKF